MKKNYRKPTLKRIVLNLENIMAAASIGAGEGEGSHDAGAKRNHFLYDDAEENY